MRPPGAQRPASANDDDATQRPLAAARRSTGAVGCPRSGGRRTDGTGGVPETVRRREGRRLRSALFPVDARQLRDPIALLAGDPVAHKEVLAELGGAVLTGGADGVGAKVDEHDLLRHAPECRSRPGRHRAGIARGPVVATGVTPRANGEALEGAASAPPTLQTRYARFTRPTSSGNAGRGH